MFGVAKLFGYSDEAEGQPRENAAAASRSQTGSAESGEASSGLWSGIASAMKARADELVKTVAQTDWKAELVAFSREAAMETKSISHKAVEVVEHIPDQAERMATHLAPKNHDMSTTISGVGSSLTMFGSSLVQGTRELFEQVRDAVDAEIAVAAQEIRQKGRTAAASASSTGQASRSSSKAKAGGSSPADTQPLGKYTRFDAEVAAMQRDSSTYCDEPAEADDYAQWKSAFALDAAQAQIDAILADNSFMAELHARIVPVVVDKQDFWLRYFFRLHKLQVKEEARQALAHRAKAHHEQEEEIGWDDEDQPEPEQQPEPQPEQQPNEQPRLEAQQQNKEQPEKGVEQQQAEHQKAAPTSTTSATSAQQAVAAVATGIPAAVSIDAAPQEAPGAAAPSSDGKLSEAEQQGAHPGSPMVGGSSRTRSDAASLTGPAASMDMGEPDACSDASRSGWCVLGVSSSATGFDGSGRSSQERSELGAAPGQHSKDEAGPQLASTSTEGAQHAQDVQGGEEKLPIPAPASVPSAANEDALDGAQQEGMSWESQEDGLDSPAQPAEPADQAPTEEVARVAPAGAGATRGEQQGRESGTQGVEGQGAGLLDSSVPGTPRADGASGKDEVDEAWGDWD